MYVYVYVCIDKRSVSSHTYVKRIIARDCNQTINRLPLGTGRAAERLAWALEGRQIAACGKGWLAG